MNICWQRPLNSYQSQCSLEDGRESVFLHHKDVGRFALHCEPVGLTVEAHRTHKVLELGQQVSQLRAQQHREDRKVQMLLVPPPLSRRRKLTLVTTGDATQWARAQIQWSDAVSLFNIIYWDEPHGRVVKAWCKSWQQVGNWPNRPHHNQVFDLGNSGFNTSEIFRLLYTSLSSPWTNMNTNLSVPCLKSLQTMWMSAKQSLRPPHHEAEDHCGEETANETLPGLLWGELQENSEKKERWNHIRAVISHQHIHKVEDTIVV